MYGKILQRLLQNFFVTMGRAPGSAAEWSKLRRQAMELAKKEGGDPITGSKISPQPELPFDTTKDLPGTGILQKRGNIIPFPKQQKSRTMTPMSGKVEDVYFDHPQDPRLYKPGIQGLMKKGDVRLGKAPKTTEGILKAKKDRHILMRDADEDILRIKRENKDAIRRFKEKNPKTVEDFRDKGDWDPYGMAEGGIAPLVGEPSYAADFYDDRTPMEEGGMTQEDFNQFLKEREEGYHEGGKRELEKDWERYKRFKKYGKGAVQEAAQGGRIGLAGGGALFKFIERLFIKASNDIRQGKGKWKGLDQKQRIVQHDNLTKKVVEFQKSGNTEGLEIYFDVNPNEAFAAASQKAKRLGKKGPNWKEQEVQAQMDEAAQGGVDMLDERGMLKQKYPGISDDLIEKILVDDNPQRKADVMGTIDDYMKLREIGKGEEEAFDIITKSFSKNPTKHAEGGRAEFIFGGSAGLKGMWRTILKGISKGKDKPIKKFFPKMSAEEKAMEKVVIGTPEQKAFRAREKDLKIEGIDLLINRLKHDKKILERQAKNKKMGDPGLDFLMKKLEENMSEAYTPHLKKYTDIDKDILDMETIKKNMIMKDRKLNAEGGRVSYSGGGRAGLPAITYGTPQMNMQGPQMPTGPQPAGIPGGTIVAQNQMQQAPWMGSQMQQGMGGMPKPGGMPRPMAAEGGRIGFGLGGFNKARRAFLKLIGGITAGGVAAGTGLLKLGKAAKVAPKVTETTEVIARGADGMPAYLTDLIEVVKAKGTRDIIEGFKRSDYSTVHRYKGVEVIEEAGGATRIKKGQEKAMYGSDEPSYHEIEMEISPQYREQIDPDSGASWYKDADGKKVYEQKIPDEYAEYTAKPDMDGKMKDVDEYIDEVDHLELKEIADERKTLFEDAVFKPDTLPGIFEKTKKTKKASGGLAYALGE